MRCVLFILVFWDNFVIVELLFKIWFIKEKNFLIKKGYFEFSLCKMFIY